MKNESFRRSFSMLCAAVGLIVLMGIAVAGQMESTEQQNQKLLSENQKLTEENERLETNIRQNGTADWTTEKRQDCLRSASAM